MLQMRQNETSLQLLIVLDFQLDLNSVSVEELIISILQEDAKVQIYMLPSKVLTLSSETLAPSITKLYNNRIEQSMWPTKWKKGEWIPVFKRDNRQERTNYRPITVLPVIGKVFESLLSKQMTESYNPYLYSKLTTYRKTHSCKTTLIGLTEEWRQAADRKENVAVLSTDMSKAFDSLHPSLMIKKLKAYGFCQTIQQSEIEWKDKNLETC